MAKSFLKFYGHSLFGQVYHVLKPPFGKEFGSDSHLLAFNVDRLLISPPATLNSVSYVIGPYCVSIIFPTVIVFTFFHSLCDTSSAALFNY